MSLIYKRKREITLVVIGVILGLRHSLTGRYPNENNIELNCLPKLQCVKYMFKNIEIN